MRFEIDADPPLIFTLRLWTVQPMKRLLLCMEAKLNCTARYSASRRGSTGPAGTHPEAEAAAEKRKERMAG